MRSSKFQVPSSKGWDAACCVRQKARRINIACYIKGRAAFVGCNYGAARGAGEYYENYDSGLTRSRSFGPRGPVASRPFLSPVGSFTPVQSAETAFASANPFRNFPSCSNPKRLKSQYGLARSRLLGPRGPVASPTFLSPLPKRLKSTIPKVTVCIFLSELTRLIRVFHLKRAIHSIHKICKKSFPGSSKRFAKSGNEAAGSWVCF